MLHFIFITLVSVFFFCSCNKQSHHSGKNLSPSQKHDVLHLSISSEIRSFDPSITVEFPGILITKMLFEGLMITGPDGQICYGTAKSHTVSEDYKTYTFTLRNTQWSNGDPVTAYDFEHAWKKVINPSQATLGVQNFYPIKNVRAVVKGEKDIDSIGIKALNARTLKVDLEHPAPYLLELVAQSSFLPINKKLDTVSADWAKFVGKGFVCNGPYTLKKHTLENDIWVEKNPSYWNAKNVSMPEIHISIIKDPTTQLGLYEKQQIEWLGEPLSKISLDALSHLRKQNKVEFTNTLGVSWIFINTRCFPFHHKKMRKAFALAINREKIVNYILQCNETPATGVLPHSIATQSEPFFKDGDVEQAQIFFNEALEELGLSKEELPEITLNHSSSAGTNSIIQAIQEQWNLAFGIDIKLEAQDWKSHFAKVQTGNFQLGTMGWQSCLRDPIYIMQTFRNCSDGLNMSRWENARYQELLSCAEQEYDLEKRKTLFNQSEILLMDEMPVIPLYFLSAAYSKHRGLKNVRMNDLMEIDYRWSFFEKQESLSDSCNSKKSKEKREI